jgi:hypothetical protein
MKHFEKRTESRTYDVLISRTCDICGRKGKGGDKREWDAGAYAINETEILVKVYQKEGSSFPEGGSGTEYGIDLCPICFKDRLVPWLISQGANIKQEDWDW